MLAGPQRGHRQFVMRVRRGADGDRIHRWIFQHRLKAAMRSDAGHVQYQRRAITHIPADVGKVAVQSSSARIAQRRDSRARHLPPRLHMGCAHEPKPDDADPLHLRWLESAQEIALRAVITRFMNISRCSAMASTRSAGLVRASSSTQPS